ncbi:ABC transporter permease [Pusillimonas sp.]|uniref:ABC transporter permease n=1 Tax=Pusillimonas sp. TaxID=3040095 RepID=UPI0029A4535D|nr:ABC transporter permease [Pusillimonas sp.]MDX3896234.1 ABC transporter permease [Pusillimonas sp.]
MIAMTEATSKAQRRGPGFRTRKNLLRLLIVVVVLAAWEVVARSGILFQDVVPPLERIAVALFGVLTDPLFYRHFGITLAEIAVGVAIGGSLGLLVGIMLGSSRFLSKAYEPLLFYLGPTPKIVFFPILIMWFGVGAGSKIAMGTLSCFFPIAISVAAGIRSIEDVLLRVGKSFRLSTWQMMTKIYLPAIREPAINGLRLGLGIAVIGTVLAETKLSNQGIGFLIIQTYATFDIPRMYALLIMLFVFAIGINALIEHYAKVHAR